MKKNLQSYMHIHLQVVFTYIYIYTCTSICRHKYTQICMNQLYIFLNVNFSARHTHPHTIRTHPHTTAHPTHHIHPHTNPPTHTHTPHPSYMHTSPHLSTHPHTHPDTGSLVICRRGNIWTTSMFDLRNGTQFMSSHICKCRWYGCTCINVNMYLYLNMFILSLCGVIE